MSTADSHVIEHSACCQQITAPMAKKSGEIFLTLCPRSGDSLLDLLKRAANEVQRRHARILSMTIFNGRAQFALAQQQLSALFGKMTWPVTWLYSEASSSDAPAGIEIHALDDSSSELNPIYLHGRVVGNMWEDSHAKYCVVQDLRSENVSQTPAAQTARVLDDMLRALEQAGMTFQQVYRTWYRNKDILSWYHDFNRVRTDFFNSQHVFDGLLPASTGISAGNPYDASLVAGLWAMQPKSPLASASVVESPLQDSACLYGSSFSRAVEVRHSSIRHLTISGTASIGRDGKTKHSGDIHGQIELTMQVVKAMLDARHMNWTDVVRGLAYFRHHSEFGAYHQWAKLHGVTLPVLVVNQTVCRDDLLYEIELDARTAN